MIQIHLAKGTGMFYKTLAPYYDKIYSSAKDYRLEVERLEGFIYSNLRSSGNRLLDVACGTGLHLQYLRDHFDIEGLDLTPELLAIARTRLPDVQLHEANMLDFDLGCKFDVVTCLFSAIGHVLTLENLQRAVQCMSRHLVPGGLLLIEPWFTQTTWKANSVHAFLIDEPELKIASANTSLVNGRLSYTDIHYLIATPQGTEHLLERLEMGLFEVDEVSRIFAAEGLALRYDEFGISGRGLYIGIP